MNPVSQLLPRALAALLLAGASSPDAAGAAEVSPVAAAQQLLLVVTPTWDSPTGTLQRFERESRSGSAVVGRERRSGSAGGWRPVGAAIAVSVGRKGLAWRSERLGCNYPHSLRTSQREKRYTPRWHTCSHYQLSFEGWPRAARSRLAEGEWTTRIRRIRAVWGGFLSNT